MSTRDFTDDINEYYEKYYEQDQYYFEKGVPSVLDVHKGNETGNCLVLDARGRLYAVKTKICEGFREEEREVKFVRRLDRLEAKIRNKFGDKGVIYRAHSLAKEYNLGFYIMPKEELGRDNFVKILQDISKSKPIVINENKIEFIDMVH